MSVRRADELRQDLWGFEVWLNTTRWVVKLSNGEVITQDDSRPGEQPPQAWLRLAEYVQVNGLRITQMWLEFRDLAKAHLPANAAGYFFKHSIMASVNTGANFRFYLIGYLDGDKVRVQRWKVPELILTEQEDRDPANEDLVGPSLIRNTP